MAEVRSLAPTGGYGAGSQVSNGKMEETQGSFPGRRGLEWYPCLDILTVCFWRRRGGGGSQRVAVTAPE